MGYWFSNFQSESDSRTWTCIFWEQKKWLEKTVVTVLGYCLFFCNLIFPPKKWENILFGNFWKLVFVSCLQQSHTFPFFHSFISKNSHSHWCFTCGSINQPRQSHNKHIPGHPGIFLGMFRPPCSASNFRPFRYACWIGRKLGPYLSDKLWKTPKRWCIQGMLSQLPHSTVAKHQVHTSGENMRKSWCGHGGRGDYCFNLCVLVICILRMFLVHGKKRGKEIQMEYIRYVTDVYIYIYIQKFSRFSPNPKKLPMYTLSRILTSTGETSVFRNTPPALRNSLARNVLKNPGIFLVRKHFEKIIVPNLYFVYIFFRLEELLTFQESFLNHYNIMFCLGRCFLLLNF